MMAVSRSYGLINRLQHIMKEEIKKNDHLRMSCLKNNDLEGAKYYSVRQITLENLRDRFEKEKIEDFS